MGGGGGQVVRASDWHRGYQDRRRFDTDRRNTPSRLLLADYSSSSGFCNRANKESHERKSRLSYNALLLVIVIIMLKNQKRQRENDVKMTHLDGPFDWLDFVYPLRKVHRPLNQKKRPIKSCQIPKLFQQNNIPKDPNDSWLLMVKKRISGRMKCAVGANYSNC